MLDNFIENIDIALRTLFAPAQSVRPHPDKGLAENELTEKEKKHALGLMRVNHCGEVCAQALYQGQALTVRNKANQDAFKKAAAEEVEHLAWTEKRVKALGGRTSALNPLWYTGSLMIGIGAGIMGDKWNLGFLEETEHQVGKHLDSHLTLLPPQDSKSRAIVAQMKIDEAQHEQMAQASGAAKLPVPIKLWMKLNGKIMTNISYWI